MTRRVAVVGSIVVLALAGVVVAVAGSARGTWWLGWRGPGKGEKVEHLPLGPDLLDRLADGREHVEIVIGGRLLAQITGCG